MSESATVLVRWNRTTHFALYHADPYSPIGVDNGWLTFVEESANGAEQVYISAAAVEMVKVKRVLI